VTQAEVDARAVSALKALLYRLTAAQVRQLAAELAAGDPLAVELCAMLERTPESLEAAGDDALEGRSGAPRRRTSEGRRVMQQALDFTRRVMSDRPILAAAGDATTSHLAAQEFVRSGRHAARVLEALQDLARWDGQPPTAMELAGGSEGRRAFYAKRLFDAIARGWVRKGTERTCRETGRLQQTWILTDEGRAAAGVRHDCARRVLDRRPAGRRGLFSAEREIHERVSEERHRAAWDDRSRRR
jgi:hypothetical protein